MKISYIMLLVVVMASTEELSLESNITIDSNSSDSTNYSLGISEKNLKYCSLIKDRDAKSSCFGIVKRDSGYCTMVKDKDIRNKCLSISLADINYCDKIKDKDLKESCKSFYLEIEHDRNQTYFK